MRDHEGRIDLPLLDPLQKLAPIAPAWQQREPNAVVPGVELNIEASVCDRLRVGGADPAWKPQRLEYNQAVKSVQIRAS